MTSQPLVAITGASSGIGAAAAQAFSAAGHPLLLMARRAGRMADLDLPDTRVAEVDVTDAAAVRDAVAAAEAAYGPVDLLVNNAGVMPLSPVVDQPEADIKMLFDVNCVALLTTAQAVLPGMRERGRGTVMNIGSIAGKNLYPDHTVYCGTKYAVHAMTEGMRRENAAHGVRVVLVAPGQVETELLSTTRSADIVAGYLDYRDSIGGGLQASDVAEAMLYAYQLPQHVCVRELVLAPTSQDA
ncbi:SDR family oxidoreductase [Jiangella rhizosphaerae]|uniref:SDR family oxidoreductase n=1 Tax=Jiangella rhizosphaerae TaxID=2293569 RepID=A0A418KKV6_9ACTN|nr:SDR family oxidoreductase [Jiangella rhizosphaerae]RIQ17832.1 SDR family oxidoreductase [Jiangella rhizosphaerae]